MAIDYVRNIISSGYNLAKINDNFVKIQEALKDGLSRSGETPNQMNADIDLNGNDLLNVKNIAVENIIFNGDNIEALVQEAKDARDVAAEEASNAEDSASEALAFKNAAANSATSAASSSVSAETSKNFAAEWASAPISDTIDDGVNPVGKSAYHWAQVALDAASGSIADGSVTTPKLADGALSADATGRAKMADGFVTETKILDGAVTEGKLAPEVLAQLNAAGTAREAFSRAAIKAAPPALVQVLTLREQGYEGTFVLKVGTRPTLIDDVNYLASDTAGYYWQRVNWIRPKAADRFVATFFRSDLDTTIDLYTSLDGRKFSRIQAGVLRESYTDNTVSGRDPGLFWYKGLWYIATTGYYWNSNSDKADCIVWVSNDLTSWQRMRLVIGNGLYNETISTVGGSVPTNLLWAPKFFEHNGDLYVIMSVRFSPNENDAGNNSIPVFRAVWAKITNFDDGNFRMFSSEWNLLDIPYASNMIDFQIYKMGPSLWWCVYKNEFNKTIEIRRSTTSPFTGYGAAQVIAFPVGVEGPCLVKRHLNDTNIGPALRIYADANYQGYEYYADSSDGGNTWVVNANKIIETQFATRHGTILNLGELPKAASDSWSDLTAFASFDRVGVPTRTIVVTGNGNFIPEDDVMYVVQSTTSATLTLSNRGARRFFICCQSGAAGAKIEIASSVLVPKAIVASVANGNNDQIIEVALSPGNAGQYYKI